MKQANVFRVPDLPTMAPREKVSRAEKAFMEGRDPAQKEPVRVLARVHVRVDERVRDALTQFSLDARRGQRALSNECVVEGILADFLTRRGYLSGDTASWKPPKAK